MPHDPNKLLFDIISACEKIMSFTNGFDYNNFATDELVKSAVHMQFIVIGEALMRLRSTNSVIFEKITDADRIISFRHIIAHGYDSIVDQIVWEVVQEKIPVLRNETKTLLNK